MTNSRITEHRLGIARQALKRIAKHKGDEWDDDFDCYISVKMEAEEALKLMDTEVDKKRKRREQEELKHLERLKAKYPDH